MKVMGSYRWKLGTGSSGGWVSTDLSLDADDELHQCPLPASGHVCWSEDGSLRAALLQPGSLFRCTDPQVPNGLLTLGDGSAIDAAFGKQPLHRLGVEFRSAVHGVDCWLDAVTTAVLPPEVERIAVRGPAPFGAVTFARQAGWIAPVSAAAGDLMSYTSLTLAERTPIAVAWSWRPGATQAIVVGREAAALTFRDRQRPVVLVLESPAPAGCAFLTSGGSWKLGARQDTETGRDGFHYGLDGIATLEAVAPDGRVKFAALEAGPFRVDVTEQLAWPAAPPPRYCAEDQGNTVAPSTLVGERHEWEYGPLRPFCCGDAGATFLVQRCDVEKGWTLDSLEPLRQGHLPTSTPADLAGAYLLRDSDDRQRYGVFSAHAAVEGRWRPAHAVTGSGSVSWLGLVDRYRVVTQKGHGDEPILTLLFEHGFELAPWFWFAAPFLGIAMTEEPDVHWWAPTHDTAQASLSRKGEVWTLEDEWSELTAGDTVARPEGACELSPPFRFFWAPLNGTRRSGPILEARNGASVPTLRGFVANDHGVVETLAGQVPLTSSPTSVGATYLLLKSVEPPTQWPADVIEAAAIARASPRRASGVTATVRWHRMRDGSVELQRAMPVASGIFLLDHVATGGRP